MALKKQVNLHFFLLNWRFSAAQWLEAICANNPVFCAKHPPFEFAFSPSAPKVEVSKTEIRIESFDIKNSKVCTFKFSSGDILAQQKSLFLHILTLEVDKVF